MALNRPSRRSKETALEGIQGLGRKRKQNTEETSSSIHEESEADVQSEHGTTADDIVEETRPLKKRGRKPGTGKKQSAAAAAAALAAIGDEDHEQSRVSEEDMEGTLFGIVKAGKCALEEVVNNWIDAYKQDRDKALVDLIQFFIHCSGCKGRITLEMYQNMEHTEIIRRMTEEFDEESGDYPLIMSGPQWKKFRNTFSEFIQVLVHHCQYSIIYDQYMMDNVISLLTGLTDSQVRAFRHTSTFAAMKLMSALVNVALNLSINLDHTQRQYEIERQKAKSKQATERLEMLLSKRRECEENQEEIRNMLTYIFKGVFVHRYRDTQADIRCICVTEIGAWMKSYPAMFLDDSYLKYVGWTLYDRVGDVRLSCVKCLQPLYETPELAPKLELFTNRFKERMVEMVLDKESDVAVQALKLVTSILKYSENVLTEKDCESVYELVYSSHRAVAQAAAEFLNTKLFSRSPEDSSVGQKTKRGKQRSVNTPLVRDLIQFFIESELHEHGAYLVDSLWDISSMLKDWECMTDLLLEEPGREEEALDDRQETMLIEIMVCAVKQAATGESPVGRSSTKKLTSKENKLIQEDKTKLTEHFIGTVPLLLAKYSVDSEKISNLLNIPLYFDLEVYTNSRQDKNLDILLKQIADIVEKHTDPEVLVNSSKVLEYFCVDDHTISGKCKIAKSSLIDGIVLKFKECYVASFQEGEETGEDEAYALMASLKRLNAFFNCHDLNPWNVWESLYAILKAGMDGASVHEEIMCAANVCCALSLLWGLQSIDQTTPDKETMKQLRKNLANYVKCCQHLLLQEQRVQEETFISLCDTLIVFGKHLATNSPQLEPLVFEPDRNLQLQLAGFLTDRVFIEDQSDMDETQKIEELHKRRNLLACFCKLVIYNVVHIKCAASMFKYYMKYYNDFGDIIKATLGKAREMNKDITARTLALSLSQLYKELHESSPKGINKQSDGFLSVKELARRFCLSFGLDLLKIRTAIAALHKEGILFSMSGTEPGTCPQYIGYLDILTEFSGKLIRQDKKVVLSFLIKQLEALHLIPDPEDDNWLPLIAYRGSLSDGSEEMRPPERPAPRAAVTKGVRGRKRKIEETSQVETTETSSGGIKMKIKLGPAPSSSAAIDTPGGVGHPVLQSTAIKKTRVTRQSTAAVDQSIASLPASSAEDNSDKDFDTGVQTRRRPQSKSVVSLRPMRSVEKFYGHRFSQNFTTKYSNNSQKSSQILHDVPSQKSTQRSWLNSAGRKQQKSVAVKNYSRSKLLSTRRNTNKKNASKTKMLTTYESDSDDDRDNDVQILDVSSPSSHCSSLIQSPLTSPSSIPVSASQSPSCKSSLPSRYVASSAASPLSLRTVNSAVVSPSLRHSPVSYSAKSPSLDGNISPLSNYTETTIHMSSPAQSTGMIHKNNLSKSELFKRSTNQKTHNTCEELDTLLHLFDDEPHIGSGQCSSDQVLSDETDSEEWFQPVGSMKSKEHCEVAKKTNKILSESDLVLNHAKTILATPVTKVVSSKMNVKSMKGNSKGYKKKAVRYNNLLFSSNNFAEDNENNMSDTSTFS